MKVSKNDAQTLLLVCFGVLVRLVKGSRNQKIVLSKFIFPLLALQDLQSASPVPHHQDQTSPTPPPPPPASAEPTVNSLASSPPERSSEAVPFYPAPSGTGTHSPLIDAVEATTVDTFVSRASHCPSPTGQATTELVRFFFFLFLF